VLQYQALIKGLELLKEVHADAVEIFGDSMLVINNWLEFINAEVRFS